MGKGMTSEKSQTVFTKRPKRSKHLQMTDTVYAIGSGQLGILMRSDSLSIDGCG